MCNGLIIVRFTRGWTLQELLAPQLMLFFDSTWGNRGTKQSLSPLLSSITHIDCDLLRGNTPMSGFSVAQKMSWAAHRETTRVEDAAYCLFGIFDLNLPLLYGEGWKAFRRLQEEIIRTTPDMSIFAWQVLPLNHDGMPISDFEFGRIFEPNSDDLVLSGILAQSPAEFHSCADYVSYSEDILGEVSISSVGIKIHSRLLTCAKLDSNEVGYVLPLSCKLGSHSLAVHLRQVGHQLYLRAEPRLLLKYDSSAMSTGEMVTIQPEERHLLLRVPNSTGHQDMRLVHESKTMPYVRSQVLQVRLPHHMTIVEPWPFRNYDHQDRLFNIPFGSRHDCVCFRVSAAIPVPLRNHKLDVFVFSGWVCAINWMEKYAQYSVVENSKTNNVAIDRFLKLASNADYHVRQIQTLLDTCGIPRALSAACPITNTKCTAVFTLQPEFVKDSPLCRNGATKLTVQYSIYRNEDIPPIEKMTWTVAKQLSRPDAVRRLASWKDSTPSASNMAYQQSSVIYASVQYSPVRRLIKTDQQSRQLAHILRLQQTSRLLRQHLIRQHNSALLLSRVYAKGRRCMFRFSGYHYKGRCVDITIRATTKSIPEFLDSSNMLRQFHHRSQCHYVFYTFKGCTYCSI